MNKLLGILLIKIQMEYNKYFISGVYSIKT